jgi:ATP-dependent protease ClpP protease subunit
MEDDKPISIFNFNDNKKSRPSKAIAQLHTFYLTGPITSPEDYIEWFETIRNASQMDVIKIHINSQGGDLFTAIQFLRVLGETQAHIICSVEGACMSAATMIFLPSDTHEISEHSMFMFHNYSGVTMGKGGEMYDNITYERKWSEKILRGSYEGFLTEEEIKSILNNKDIWMTGEEVIKRLKSKKVEKSAQKTKVKKDDIKPEPVAVEQPANDKPAVKRPVRQPRKPKE